MVVSSGWTKVSLFVKNALVAKRFVAVVAEEDAYTMLDGASPLTFRTPPIVVEPVFVIFVELMVPSHAVVPESSVEVAFVKVCSPVQLLACPGFKEPTTLPVVGEIVREPSEFETVVTALPPQAVPVPVIFPLISA